MGTGCRSVCTAAGAIAGAASSGSGTRRHGLHTPPPPLKRHGLPADRLNGAWALAHGADSVRDGVNVQPAAQDTAQNVWPRAVRRVGGAGRERPGGRAAPCVVYVRQHSAVPRVVCCSAAADAQMRCAPASIAAVLGAAAAALRVGAGRAGASRTHSITSNASSLRAALPRITHRHIITASWRHSAELRRLHSGRPAYGALPAPTTTAARDGVHAPLNPGVHRASRPPLPRRRRGPSAP